MRRAISSFLFLFAWGCFAADLCVGNGISSVCYANLSLILSFPGQPPLALAKTPLPLLPQRQNNTLSSSSSLFSSPFVFKGATAVVCTGCQEPLFTKESCYSALGAAVCGVAVGGNTTVWVADAGYVVTSPTERPAGESPASRVALLIKELGAMSASSVALLQREWWSAVAPEPLATAYDGPGSSKLGRVVADSSWTLSAALGDGNATNGVAPFWSSLSPTPPVLWEMEQWITPLAVMVNPDAAEILVRYRWGSLGAAEKESQRLGWKGALWPWAGSVNGTLAPGAPAGDGKAFLASAGLASAAYSLFLHTSKVPSFQAFARSVALPCAALAADFVVSRCPSAGCLGVVIDPSLSQGVVNNSALVNQLASAAVRSALDFAQALPGVVPDITTSSWISWLNGGGAPLPVAPVGTPNAGVHLRYDQFAFAPFAGADMAVAAWRLPAAEASKDLAAYGNLTVPGGLDRVGHSSFAIAYSRAGEMELAENQLGSLLSSLVSAEEQQGGLLWPATAGPVYTSGQAGLLMHLILVYGGWSANASALALTPRLPRNATALFLSTLHYQGSRFSLNITADGAWIRAVRTLPGFPLALTSSAKRVRLDCEGKVKIPLGSTVSLSVLLPHEIECTFPDTKVTTIHFWTPVTIFLFTVCSAALLAVFSIVAMAVRRYIIKQRTSGGGEADRLINPQRIASYDRA
jgi:hypothetical protein